MKPFFLSTEMQQRLRAAAQGWLGVRFRDFGRTRQGVDCIGCGLGVYREAGFPIDLEIPRYTMDGGHHRDESPLVQELSRSPQFQLVEESATGDLLCFRFGRQPWHVGILVQPPNFIHVYRDIGKVVESSLNDPTWRKRLTHIFRPVELTTENTEEHGE